MDFNVLSAAQVHVWTTLIATTTKKKTTTTNTIKKKKKKKQLHKYAAVKQQLHTSVFSTDRISYTPPYSALTESATHLSIQH